MPILARVLLLNSSKDRLAIRDGTLVVLETIAGLKYWSTKPSQVQIMANETPEAEPTKEKEKEPKIRDLKSKDDVKGGAPAGKKNGKGTPRRTGEVDFMKYMK